MCPVRVVVGLAETVEKGVEGFDVNILCFFVNLMDDLFKGISLQTVESVVEQGMFLRECSFLSRKLVPGFHDRGAVLVWLDTIILGSIGKAVPDKYTGGPLISVSGYRCKQGQGVG